MLVEVTITYCDTLTLMLFSNASCYSVWSVVKLLGLIKVPEYIQYGYKWDTA